VYDDPIVRYISIQNTKRAADAADHGYDTTKSIATNRVQLGESMNPSVVVHTNVQFVDELESTGSYKFT
jgi:hypothetical protein